MSPDSNPSFSVHLLPTQQVKVPESRELGVPPGMLWTSPWEGLQGSLDSQRGQDAGGESWDPQVLGRLKQGLFWPLGLVVVRDRTSWLAGRQEPGRGQQGPGWSQWTRHGVT